MSPDPQLSQSLAGLSYGDALSILDKSKPAKVQADRGRQDPPSGPKRSGAKRRGLRLVGLVGGAAACLAGVGFLGQASQRVLDCPTAASPWRPDCAPTVTLAAREPASPGLSPPRVIAPTSPVAPAAVGNAAVADPAPPEGGSNKRSVVARGTPFRPNGVDPGVAPPAVGSSARLDEPEKPSFSLSTASPTSGPTLPGEVRQAARDIAPVPTALRVLRPDEPKRAVVADRAAVAERGVADRAPLVFSPPSVDPGAPAQRAVAAPARSFAARVAPEAPEEARPSAALARRSPEPSRDAVEARPAVRPPLVDAMRQPPLPPIRPGLAAARPPVLQVASIPSVPSRTAVAPIRPVEPARPRTALARANEEPAEPAPRSLRRSAPRPEAERPDVVPRAFAQAVRDHNRGYGPRSGRADGFPTEFAQVLREHNMAYSSGAGRRSPGW